LKINYTVFYALKVNAKNQAAALSIFKADGKLSAH